MNVYVTEIATLSYSIASQKLFNLLFAVSKDYTLTFLKSCMLIQLCISASQPIQYIGISNKLLPRAYN